MQLVELQGRLEELRKSGMGVAAISYDPARVLEAFASQRGITYPLLSDEGSAIIRRFGILNTTIPKTHEWHGIPFPGTFILNREGVVTARVFEEAYQERDTISSVMVRLGGRLDRPATKISAPHIAITSYASDAAAARGTRFSLVLDVVPEPKIHVYAPGAAGYRTIALKVQEQPGLVVRDAHYPESEMYHFKPLDERVPVFQRPFRLVQDLMLDFSREGAAALRGKTSLTIEATLEYQACDDTICYRPQSVPLSWTIAVKPLDTGRVNRQ